jgi:hypothetical protein
LSILQSDLGGESDCESHNDLEADPFSRACRLIHGVEQAAANSTERAADEPENGDDADLREGKALRNSCETKRDDQGQHTNTRADRVCVVDALEVDWQVVEDNEVGAGEEDHEECAGPDILFCELRSMVSGLVTMRIG